MQNYKLPKILFLSFFLLVFIFSIFFSNEILTSLGLLLLFLVILVFIFNPQIGLFFLIILRINLDYFRDWEVFTIRDLFSLNFGALFGVFILIFVFYWIIVKKTNILKISNSLPIILFLIISLISIFYSGYQFLSLKEWIRIASFFAIYFLTFDLIKSKKSFPLIQKTFFISAIIPSLLGFWQILKNTGLRDDAGFLRIYGSFAHPNAFSYFLIIILTLLVYSFILEQNKKIKKYYLIFIILNIILLLFTYSRGAWLCLFIILFLLSFLKYRKKLITSLIILLFLSSSVLFIDNWSQKNYNYSFLYNFSLTRRIAEITNFNPRTSSFLWRIELWKDMADVFWQKPIFGHGIGSFEKEVLKKRGFYAGSYEAHNDYLCIAVELGIIGLASYLSLILIFLKNIIKIYKKTTDKNFKLLYLMFFCLSISLFSVNFSENILRNTIIQWCFWVLAGFIFKSSKLTEK